MELMSYDIRSNAVLCPHGPLTALPHDWDDWELPNMISNDVRDHRGFDIVV
jgi:hypothetical protein